MERKVYEEVRDQINTGDLLLWHTYCLESQIIELKNNTSIKCSHSSVTLRLEGLRTDWLFDYGSLENGFEPHLLSKRLADHDGRVYWFPLKDSSKIADIEEQIRKYDGTPYGWKDLVAMAFYSPDKEPSEMICSEAVDIVVTGNVTGKILAPWDLPSLGLWGEPVEIIIKEAA